MKKRCLASMHKALQEPGKEAQEGPDGNACGRDLYGKNQGKVETTPTLRKGTTKKKINHEAKKQRNPGNESRRKRGGGNSQLEHGSKKTGVAPKGGSS